HGSDVEHLLPARTHDAVLPVLPTLRGPEFRLRLPGNVALVEPVGMHPLRAARAFQMQIDHVTDGHTPSLDCPHMVERWVFVRTAALGVGEVGTLKVLRGRPRDAICLTT